MMGLVAMELHGCWSMVAVNAGGRGRVIVAAACWGSYIGLRTASCSSPVLVAGVVVGVTWRGRHLHSVTIPGRPTGGVSAAGRASVVEPSGAVARAAGCMAGWPARSCGCGHAEPVVASCGKPGRRWKTTESTICCQASHAVHPVGPATSREPAACHRPQSGSSHLSVK